MLAAYEWVRAKKYGTPKTSPAEKQRQLDEWFDGQNR